MCIIFFDYFIQLGNPRVAGRSPVARLPRLTIPPTSGISFALVMAVAPASRRA